MARLRAALRDRRVAVLFGVPGIGKTALVWELLASARDEGRPTAWVEVGPDDGIESVLGRLAADLGVSIDRPSIGTFLGAVDACRARVAIDSAELLSEGAVRALCRHATGRMRDGRLLLATRRLPRLAPRDRLDVHVEEIGLLAPDDAAALFEESGGRRDEAASWPGHPLLLKLRATLGAEPSREPPRRIDDSVRAVVRETLDGLGREERRALALLCLAPVSWPEPMLAEVVDPASVEALARRGAATLREGRWHLHPLFARAGVESAPDARLLRRAGNALARLAATDPTAGLAAAESLRRAGDHTAAMRALHAVVPLVALHGLRGPFEAAVQSLRPKGRWRALARLDVARIRLVAGRPEVAVLEGLARSRDRETSRLAREALARVAHVQNRFEDAKRHAASVAAEVAPEDPVGWSARLRLFQAHRRLGESEEATVVLEELSASARDATQIGLAALARCDLVLAHGRLRAVLEASRRLVTRRDLPPALAASALLFAGNSLWQMGRPRLGLACFERAAALVETRSPLLAVDVAGDRARALLALGRSNEALRVVDAAAEVADLPPKTRFDLLEARAAVRFARGRLRESLDDFDGARSNPSIETERVWVEVRALREAGRSDHALAVADRALAAPHARIPYQRAQLAVARAHVLADLGGVDEGLEALSEAAPILAAERIHPWLSRLWRERARLELGRGRVDEAHAAIQRAARHARLSGAPDEVASATIVRADVDRALGHVAEATRGLEDAVVQFDRMGDRLGAADALSRLSALAISAARPDEALERLRDAHLRIDGAGASRLESAGAVLAAAAHLARRDVPAARASIRRLRGRDPWRARLEVAIEVVGARRTDPSVEALARALGKLRPFAASRILREAEALGLPSAGRVLVVGPDGRRETSREEAAWAARSNGIRIVLDRIDGSCRVGSRSCAAVARSSVLSRLLGVLLSRSPEPTPPADLFQAVWGPPERHQGWANLVWFTVWRLRKLVGPGDSVVAWSDAGYHIAPGCSFLLVLPSDPARDSTIEPARAPLDRL